ncbi:MAG: phospholipase [Paludibacter sp.]
MLILILLLVGLGVVLFIVTYFQRKNQTAEPEVILQTEGECCGAHLICEKDTLLNSNNKVIYYDDEELDALVDIPASTFNNEQINQISEVFYTLNESDVAGWVRSLQIRRIELPTDLREQALLIVMERRKQN